MKKPKLARYYPPPCNGMEEGTDGEYVSVEDLENLLSDYFYGNIRSNYFDFATLLRDALDSGSNVLKLSLGKKKRCIK